GVDVDARNVGSNSYDSRDRTALGLATRKGHIEIVKLLIDEGADVNVKYNGGFTPLQDALLKRGNDDIVELLVEKGANVNVQSDRCSSPLMLALWEHFSEHIIELLIVKGADVNANAVSFPILNIAAIWPSEKIAKLMLTKGADLNAVKPGNTTPLMHAAINNKTDRVRLFLSSGANVNAWTRLKKTTLTYTKSKEITLHLTALDFAKKHHHNEIIDLLRSWGGKTWEELKTEGT
ncbi:uncharacterized protein METZ01_LOCUS393100, partial [marine metagenome]